MAEQEKAPKKKLGTGAKIAIGCGGIILLGIIIFIALAIAGVNTFSKVVNEVDQQIQEEEQQDEDKFNNPAGLGEVVTVGDIEWKVTGVEELGSTLESTYGGEDCVANSGEFVQVTIELTNNGSEMASVTNLYLYDSNKREFITSSDIYGCVDDELYLLDNINPGITKTFIAIYEIPEDSEGLRLKVGDLDLFTEGHEYISLGI
jgi:hypothetical protein